MKSDVFKKELGYIRNENYRRDTITLLELLPDYFYSIPASSSGKYHPEFAAGEGGLVRHTKVAVKIAYDLSQNNSIGNVFEDYEKDLIIMALLLHDGLKGGLEKQEFTVFEHSLLMSDFIKSNSHNLSLNEKEIFLLTTMIESHMGEWNTHKYSKIILPKPTNKYQKFVHMCDYLASRKFVNVKFDGDEIIG